jgi:predicted TIM-barrel enzyme
LVAHSLFLGRRAVKAIPPRRASADRSTIPAPVPHIGLTSGGTTGPAGAMTLDEAVTATQDLIAARAHRCNRLGTWRADENPEDVAYVLERTNAQGFVGASSIDRWPIETAIVSAIKAFKQIPLDTRK